MVRKAVLPGRGGRRFRRCASTRPGGEGGDPARADCERDRADLAGPDGDDAHPAGAVRADADGPHPGAVDAHTDGAADDVAAAGAAVAGRTPATRDDPDRADTASCSADDLDDGHRPLAAAGPRGVAVSVPQLHPLLGLDVVRRAEPSATPSTTARPQRKALAARVQRSRNRVSVRLAFVLPKADRLFVIVRGPAPSCRIAGYIPVRGRRGANTVFFAGRVHGRRLEPGVYLLSLSTNRRLDPSGATEYVRVVSRRRSVPLPGRTPKASCSDVAGASTSDAIERTVLAGAVAKTSRPRPSASLAGTAAGSPSGNENDDGASGLPESGVLGAATGDASERPFVAIAVLTIVGALLLTMLVLVTRFLRGSWNP